MARIIQLSAHEVGHTLGFAHNFASSSNNRASVMDYPHPLLAINKDGIDFSNSYSVGIGDWDKVSVAYSYSEINDQNEKPFLDNILEERYRELAFEGHRFLDLKRTGNDVVRDDSDCSFLAANNACTLQNSNYLFTLPIPQSEIFVNPSLIQNPGY